MTFQWSSWGAARYPCQLLQTGQRTQYSGELDDGYYQKGTPKPTAAYTIMTTGSQSGTTNVDLTHLVSDTGAFTAADKTYTDAGKCGVFKAAGGETIVISGSASNNGTFTTSSATANTVVFVQAIVNEPDAPMTTFKKREAMSNNVVFDNNTGLMWMRYKSTKQGAAGDGNMVWTGNSYDAFDWCAACNAVSVGGYSDWRVANIYELISIYDSEAPTPLPDSTAFPSWSNTQTLSSTTAVNAITYCLCIIGSNGQLSGGTKLTDAKNVALVRGG